MQAEWIVNCVNCTLQASILWGEISVKITPLYAKLDTQFSFGGIHVSFGCIQFSFWCIHFLFGCIQFPFWGIHFSFEYITIHFLLSIHIHSGVAIQF